MKGHLVPPGHETPPQAPCFPVELRGSAVLGISRWKGSNYRKPAAAVAPIHRFLAMFNLHNLQGLGVAADVCPSNKTKELPIWRRRCHCCSNTFPKSLRGSDCFMCILPSKFSISNPSTAVPVSLLTLFILWCVHTCSFPPRAMLETAGTLASENKHAYYGLKLRCFSFPSTFQRNHKAD